MQIPRRHLPAFSAGLFATLKNAGALCLAVVLDEQSVALTPLRPGVWQAVTGMTLGAAVARLEHGTGSSQSLLVLNGLRQAIPRAIQLRGDLASQVPAPYEGLRVDGRGHTHRPNIGIRLDTIRTFPTPPLLLIAVKHT